MALEDRVLRALAETLQKIYVSIFILEKRLPRCSKLSLTTCSIQREMLWSFQL